MIGPPSDAVRLLRLHEDERLKPYDDHSGRQLRPGDMLRGRLTIGVGRNLSDRGITAEESAYLLSHDIEDHWRDLLTAVPWAETLDVVRRTVLLDMAFNLGVPGLLKFKRTLALIQQGQWHDASVAMLQSEWADQVGARSLRLAEMMRTGKVERRAA